MTTPYGQQPQPPYGQNPQPPQGGYPPPPVPPKPPRAWWKRKRVLIPAAVLLVIVVIGVSTGPKPATSTGPQAAGSTAVAAAPAAATQDTTPAEPPASPPTVYQGRGDDVVTITKDRGVAVLDFECAKCSGNTVVETDGADTLLVNDIGAHKGRYLIDTSDNSVTSTLTVKATGAWKITVSSGLGVLRKTTGQPITGSGDDVILVQGSTSKAHIANKGSANFVVNVYGASSSDLAVNEIGSYDGTVPLDAPAAVAITSSGTWTVAPS